MHLLKYFDRIVVLQQGKIFADGSLQSLFEKHPEDMEKITGLKLSDVTASESSLKSSFYHSYRVEVEDQKHVESEDSNTANRGDPKDDETAPEQVLLSMTSLPIAAPRPAENNPLSNSSQKEKKLIEMEKADSGVTTLVAYVKYFSASLTSVGKVTRDPFYSESSTKKVFSYSLLLRGSLAIFGLLFIFTVSQVVRVGVDLYLALYVEHYGTGNNLTLYKNLYFSTFGIFIFSLLIRSTYLNLYSVRSSQVLHAYMLRRILSAPIPTFFDTHTIGAILNRFSKDIETVDVNIPEFMLQTIINWFQVFSIFALCLWAAYWFAIILIPLCIGYYRVYHYFSRASKSLKQLEAVSRSPIYSLLSETLSGLETIRAYGDTDRFIRIFDKRMRRNHKLLYHSFIVASWMTIRLELSTSLILLAVALLAVTIRDIVSPISLGLALSYGLQLTALFQRCIQLLIEMTNYMNSTERVLEYLEKPQEINRLASLREAEAGDDHGLVDRRNREEELETGRVVTRERRSRSRSYSRLSNEDSEERDRQILSNWPQTGDIELKGVWMQYRDNPPVLRGLSVKISGGQRVGVCGRTGAGKVRKVLLDLLLPI